jgi:ADP-ribose pyrophosphatase YjhB (NUDIX family)
MVIDQSWYVKPPGIRQDISAGGVVMRRVAGRAWVALVAEEGFSHYFLPKGRCESGEDLHTTALREIEEEAGLTNLKYLKELGVYERLNYTKKAWKVIHYFLFEALDRTSRPTDTRHAYRCDWFPLDALPSLLWPEQEEILGKLLDSLKDPGG